MMKRTAGVLSFTFALALTAGQLACSSSSSGGGGTGGAVSGTGGTPATGGTTGTGGASTGGSVGTGGSLGTGGSAGSVGTGGRGGAGGTAGSAGATGGAAGQGGRGGGAGNGASTGGAAGGNSGGGGTGAGLTLTSAAFTEGMMIPAAQTCTGGAHMSPALTWTAGPSATKSYGIALLDMSNGYVHWTIWDLPPGTTSLPGNLPKTQMLTTPVTAQQVNRFQGDGYFGPCPSGQTHTYVFEVYALDVATLPSVSATSTPETVRMQMMMHALAVGTLSGTSNASM